MSHRKKHIKSKIRRLRPPKPLLKRKLFWFPILFLLLLIGFCYLFLFFPKFQIKNIIVSGNEKIKTEEIEKIALEEINKTVSKSFFLINAENIIYSIKHNFPLVEEVRINKLFQDIRIDLTERKPVAAYCGEDKKNAKNCFLIDKNGVIFESIDNIPKNTIEITDPMQIEELLVGNSVISKNIMDAVLQTEKMLKDGFQIDIREALISTPSKLDIITAENWQAYFNLDSDISPQVIKLNLLLKNEIPEGVRKGLKYIDLRFKDRAYYK